MSPHLCLLPVITSYEHSLLLEFCEHLSQHILAGTLQNDPVWLEPCRPELSLFGKPLSTPPISYLSCWIEKSSLCWPSLYKVSQRLCIHKEGAVLQTLRHANHVLYNQMQ